MADFNYVQLVDYKAGALDGIGSGGSLSDPDPNLNGEFDLGESAGFWTYIGTVTVDGKICPAFEFSLDPSDQRYYDPGPTPSTPPPTFPTVTPQSLPFCFAEGTMISTPTGETAVERLSAGDLVVTSDGESVPVKWIGRQTILPAFQPAERLMPVRFAAGSLGPNQPTAELTVTADHGMLVEGVLCQASALVNGTTITRVPLEQMGDRFMVYHVETEGHRVILANGATAETFIDYSARRSFDNYAEYVDLFGADQAGMEELPMPRCLSRRQLPVAIRARLDRQAEAALTRTSLTG